MSNFLYITIVILLVLLWTVGYFVLNAGVSIHILLIIALIVVLFKKLN